MYRKTTKSSQGAPDVKAHNIDPEEGGQMEISGEDEGDAPGELEAVVRVLASLDGLHHRRGDPAGVRQDERHEQVGVDFISQAPHFP